MKEDIEYLENVINDNYIIFEEAGEYLRLNHKMMTAIEKLIKAYKELERKLEMFSKQNIEYSKTLENLQKNTIHKDKIREKIDEAIEKYAEEKSTLIQIATKGVILALQELLEEE